jgi:hypothetical protein
VGAIDIPQAHAVSSPNINHSQSISRGNTNAEAYFTGQLYPGSRHVRESDARRDLVRGRWVDDFRCGVGCFCGLRKTWTYFNVTFHLSALLTLAASVAITVALNTTHHDSAQILGTPLWRYWFALDYVLAISYVGTLLQAGIEWGVDALLSTTPFQNVYFWAAGVASTFALLGVTFCAYFGWEDVLHGITAESHPTSHSRINNWLAFFLIISVCLVVRKYLILSAMFHFNRSKYLRRAAKMKLQEQVVLDLCGKEALVDENDNSHDSLQNFAKLLRFFSGGQATLMPIAVAQKQFSASASAAGSSSSAAPTPAADPTRPLLSPRRAHATFRASLHGTDLAAAATVTSGPAGAAPADTAAASDAKAASADSAASAALTGAVLGSAVRSGDLPGAGLTETAPRHTFDLLEADAEPVSLQGEIEERGFQNMNGGPYRFTVTRNHGTVARPDIVAQAVANRIMAMLDKDQRGFITLADLERRYTRATAAKAFAFFDSIVNDGRVDHLELEQVLRKFYRERAALVLELNNYRTIGSVLENIVATLYWIVVAIVFMVTFDYAVTGTLVTLASLLLSLSFAVAAEVEKYVASLRFILLQRPYYVGDRIMLPESADRTAILLVTHIHLMTTTFTDTSNRNITVPNNLLAQLTIVNLKRSGNLSHTFSFHVGLYTPLERINALADRMFAFVQNNRLTWCPQVWIAFGTMDTEKDSLELLMTLDHRESPDNWERVASDKTAVLNAVRFFLRDLGIRTPATLKVASVAPADVLAPNPAPNMASIFHTFSGNESFAVSAPTATAGTPGAAALVPASATPVKTPVGVSGRPVLPRRDSNLKSVYARAGGDLERASVLHTHAEESDLSERSTARDTEH